jgi:hypothetical protein
MPLTSTMPEPPVASTPDLESPIPRAAEPQADRPEGASDSPPEAQGYPASHPFHTPEEEAELTRIKDLPKEVGVMLLTVGALGFVLPGVVGAPAAIAGGLVLWPKAFGKVENWFERRFPKAHKHSLYQINRYLNDLESRYPDATRRD